jgi:hypothetical protein
VAWHERAPPIVGRVRVAAGGTATINFDIPLPRPGGAGRDR